MSYSTPPPVIKHGVEIFFRKLADTPVLVGQVLATPNILAKWQIVRDSSVLAKAVGVIALGLYGAGKRTAGIGNVTLGFLTSPDDVTYSELLSTGSANAAYVDITSTPQTDRIVATEFFIAIALYNSNGATAGNIKEVQVHTWLQVTEKHTIKRII